MKMLFIELKKERRTGVVSVLLSVGFLGAAYAFLNFAVRGHNLLSLPLEPMDILLTQLYGMIMVLNMFAIILAACMIYNIEFGGNAIKKMYMLPVNSMEMFLGKFIILTVVFGIVIVVQNIALALIGVNELQTGEFIVGVLIKFAIYTFVTSMPVLSFMLFISSRMENVWIPLGIGVAGFLSGMALANYESVFWLLHPFVVMLKPAVAMSADVDIKVMCIAVVETITYLVTGLGFAKYLRYE